MPRRHAQIARKFPHRPVGRGFVTLCSFVTAHPGVCKRQILRARSGRSCKAKQIEAKQSARRASWFFDQVDVEVGCLRLRRVTSDLGWSGSNTRERTHVLTSCRPNPPKPVELGLHWSLDQYRTRDLEK